MLVALIAGLFAIPAFAESIQSWTRQKNTILLTLDQGSAEFEWISHSTFRFQRCSKPACVGRPGLSDAILFATSDKPDRLEFRTDHLIVELSKKTTTIHARSVRGRDLLTELPSTGSNFARACNSTEQIFGLGPRDAPELNLRGQKLISSRPLMISTLGYGQFFATTGAHEFDLCHSDPGMLSVKPTVTGRIEYFFYYGPSPKEILEEHCAIAGPIRAISPLDVGVLKSQTLPAYATRVPEMPLLETIRYLSHAAFSGILAPVVGLDQSTKALFPLATGIGSSHLRTSLKSYLFTYLQEARDRGIPMLRPLAMQFSSDPQSSKNIDEFMIGDEILVAGGETLYLPQGIWTDLRDWKTHKGRQTIPIVKSEMPPAFVKNGAILPLDAPDGHIELHYFPRLGAEFFLAEPGDDLPTQAHAAPSTDYLRLEIESRVERDYVWVVHHVSEALKVEPKTEFTYDAAQRTLRVPAKAKQDSDIIYNITLKEPLE